MRARRCRRALGVLLLAGLGCKPAPEWTPADTSGLDDDFQGKSLDAKWRVFDGDRFAREVRDGELHLTPNANVVWYRGDHGPMLHQAVTGNFRVTARVRARSAKHPAQGVKGDYQFGGLIARDPASDRSGQESYVFNVVGYRKNTLSVETKTTRNDHSEVLGPEWDSADAELRICRHDGKVLVLKRHLEQADWELGTRYDRPDLAATLQVGPIAYTYTDAFDLRASFEFVRFDGVASESDCYTNRP
jgi:hypothetical protein